MTAPPAAQREYRAACPACGAPVTFQSAQSTHAICAYCRSMVVRQGEVLQRIGKMAELFDDHSLLQLGAAGRIDGQSFTLVGRLQYQYPEGTWTEWHAVLADGSTGWLSEDNGAYVFARPLAVPDAPLAPADSPVGTRLRLAGQTWVVSASTRVALRAAQGELPHLPPLGQAFALLELRSQDGSAAAAQRVLTIDFSSQPPTVSAGRPVLLAELALTGLKDVSARETSGRQFNCPHCGAPVAPLLAQSKSITCAQCHALIDLNSGIGGELRHALQDEPVRPAIALGTVGQLQGVPWQVVGFQHRLGRNEGDDESFGWQEYLLYHAQRGFCFLVDADDGWSLVAPTTGVPALSRDGQRATYNGVEHTLQWSYRAETSYVLGEFYWQVQRGQITHNRDYAQGRRRLSEERAATETTWSAGSQLSAAAVAAAFKLDAAASAPRADARPFSAAPSVSVWTILIVLLLIVVVLGLLSRCNRCDPSREVCGSSGTSARSSGGSYGGYSSGGGHK